MNKEYFIVTNDFFLLLLLLLLEWKKIRFGRYRLITYAFRKKTTTYLSSITIIKKFPLLMLLKINYYSQKKLYCNG